MTYRERDNGSELLGTPLPRGLNKMGYPLGKGETGTDNPGEKEYRDGPEAGANEVGGVQGTQMGQTERTNRFTKYFPTRPDKALELEDSILHDTEHFLQVYRDKQADGVLEDFKEEVNEDVKRIIKVFERNNRTPEFQIAVAHILFRYTGLEMCEMNTKKVLGEMLPPQIVELLKSAIAGR